MVVHIDSYCVGFDWVQYSTWGSFELMALQEGLPSTIGIKWALSRAVVMAVQWASHNYCSYSYAVAKKCHKPRTSSCYKSSEVENGSYTVRLEGQAGRAGGQGRV